MMNVGLGLGWQNAIHPEDRESIIKEFDQGIDQGKVNLSEYRFLAQTVALHG
jgi:hypothetical protein